MATTRPEKPEKRLRKKKKPPKKIKLSYSLLLLIGMVVVGSVTGLVAYRFGKQALEGVNPSPAGAKSPKVSPPPKPKDAPKSSSSSEDGKIAFLLDETEVVTTIKAQFQQELGALVRPAFVAKANTSDRKKIYTRLEREYKSLRDPLAVSANADERIAESIAALRQRVYTSSRSYERDNTLNRPIANSVSTSTTLLSKPIEIAPIRSRWEDRDPEVLRKTTSDFFVTDQQTSNPVEVNRR